MQRGDSVSITGGPYKGKTGTFVKKNGSNWVIVIEETQRYMNPTNVVPKASSPTPTPTHIPVPVPKNLASAPLIPTNKLVPVVGTGLTYLKEQPTSVTPLTLPPIGQGIGERGRFETYATVLGTVEKWITDNRGDYLYFPKTGNFFSSPTKENYQPASTVHPILSYGDAERGEIVDGGSKWRATKQGSFLYHQKLKFVVFAPLPREGFVADEDQLQRRVHKESFGDGGGTDEITMPDQNGAYLEDPKTGTVVPYKPELEFPLESTLESRIEAVIPKILQEVSYEHLQKLILEIISSKKSPLIPYKESRDGFIYVMQSPKDLSRVKIGFAVKPEQRLASGRTFIPDLRIVGVFPSNHYALAEKISHAMLKHYRLKESGPGNEWFSCTRQLAALVCAEVTAALDSIFG